MNEASFTTSFKKKLEQHDFYFKKLADRTTRGIPDCFIAKHKKGFFAEIKFIELKTLPNRFNQWSKIVTGKGMVQLTTMVELNQNFLSRYIICYRVNNKNYLTLILPERLLRGIKEDYDVDIIPIEEDAFFTVLHNLLQI
jgi:hypothetical protein